jgi:PAS domain S-box-containing protein
LLTPELIANKAFFDTYTESILIVSQHGQFVYANTPFFALTGYHQSDLTGSVITKLLSDLSPAHYAPATSWLTKADGTSIKLRASISPVQFTDHPHGCCYTLVPLTNHVAQTSDSAKRFYELADASPAMIFLQDHEGKAFHFNKAWLEFTGKTLPELLNTQWQTLIFPDDLKVLKDSETDVMDRKSYSCEYRLSNYDGAYRNLFVINTPITTGEGIFDGYMSSCLDITEIKEAQTTIAQLSHTLKQSNEELDQFTYVISHDLQEPLRMITGYIQLIQKNIEKGNLGAINEFMEFVLSGTARMQMLIADILHLSRLNRKGAPFAPVDMKEVLRVALSHLSKKIDGRQAKISCKNLPVVNGDTFQLVSFFENILDNALKFTPLGTPPEITINSHQNDEKYIFEVKDNGIGIDNKFHKRIFAIFQRLHTRGEYEGTGIGLAVCKKIVERHGGEIWVESEPGEGSTFYFSIKK